DGVPLLALTAGAVLPQLGAELAEGKSLSGTAGLANSGKFRGDALGKHFLWRLSADANLAAVEGELLLSLEHPRDGQVDAYSNRKLCRRLTRWLLRTPLSPNQITVLSGVVGVLGALWFVPGGYWGPLLGALLLQFSVVLDCCDGEVARM